MLNNLVYLVIKYSPPAKTTAPENNSFLYGRLNKHYEMKFYQQASKVLFTHDDARKIHIKEFQINPSITAVGQPISKFQEDLYEQTKNYNYTNNDIVQNAKYIEPNNRIYVNTGSFYKLYEYGISGYAERAGYDPIELGFTIAKVRNGKLIGVDKIVI